MVKLRKCTPDCLKRKPEHGNSSATFLCFQLCQLAVQESSLVLSYSDNEYMPRDPHLSSNLVMAGSIVDYENLA